MNYTVLLLGAACLLLASGCKKDRSSELTCDIVHSRLTDQQWAQADGGYIYYKYTYDERNRVSTQVTEITQNGQISTGTAAYQYVNDSFVQFQPVAAWHAAYSFDGHGWPVQNQTFGSSFSTITNNIFNNAGELIESTSSSSGFTYEWKDGNLTRRDYPNFFGHYNAYEYYPNTDGHQLFNIPEETAMWIYNPVAPVVSKNLIHKIILHQEPTVFTTIYDYVLDNHGRPTRADVTNIRTEATDTTINKSTIYYKYKCI